MTGPRSIGEVPIAWAGVMPPPCFPCFTLCGAFGGNGGTGSSREEEEGEEERGHTAGAPAAGVRTDRTPEGNRRGTQGNGCVGGG